MQAMWLPPDLVMLAVRELMRMRHHMHRWYILSIWILRHKGILEKTMHVESWVNTAWNGRQMDKMCKNAVDYNDDQG